MHLGLVTYNLAKDWDFDTCLAKCAALGYEGIEFRTTHAHGVEPTLTAAERKVLRAKAEASPVKLVGLGSTCEFHSTDPAEVQKNIQLAKDFVDLAADLGVLGVKVRPNGLPEGVPVEKTLKQIGESLKPLGDYGAKKGVMIYVECHGRGTAFPPYMATIFGTANHPNVGACWNCNPQDIVNGSIKEYFTLIRPWMRTIHIHELSKDYPWQELFELLVATKFDGYTLLEEGNGNADPERILTLNKTIWDLRLAQASSRGCCCK
ncbi:MAG: sugar phosphate isomerase/epimerase [Chloroflexi bacterium]|nr:sugar phosphate isomerase/epimerase [Chloroflexota bacterium]